ncbi:MAG: hypothetical protein EB127_01370 [Alphaproteobacteria bacterium]|nr:hypothetical protein [Alphaproteobacteria bacterium]
MGKLILQLDDDDLNIFKKQYINQVDLHDEIEKLFVEGEKLDKRKKKIYQAWKEKVNFLIDMYNSRASFKTYNKVK